MKRVQIVLISGLGLFAIGCGVLIWQLLGAMGTLSEARENNVSNMEQLQRLYKQKIFPTKQNIEQIRKDENVLAVWVDMATNQLRRGAVSVSEQTPSGFKQLLQDTVRDLSSQPGQVAGKICAPNFYFGFDKYLGDSAVLPDSKFSTKLAVQLVLIDKICRELMKAGAVQIDLVEREKFDDKQEEVEEQPREERRNRRSRRRNAEAAQREEASQSSEPALAAKQSFTIGFHARPAALIEALNGLARIEPFMAVSSVSMSAGGDPLMAYAQSLSAEDAIKAREKEEGEEASVAGGNKGEIYRKIVTSPEMEAPLKVKVRIDVYNFEGV